MTFFITLLAVLAGLVFSVQGPVNSQLGRITNSLQATMISFGGGVLVLIFIVIFLGSGDLSAVTQAAPWQVIGGLFGAYGVFVATTCIPVLGAALTVMITMLGQLFMSAVIDGLGLFGTDVIAISVLRMAGILAVVIGILFVYRGNAAGDRGPDKDKHSADGRLSTDDSKRSADAKCSIEGKCSANDQYSAADHAVSHPHSRIFYMLFACSAGMGGAMQSPINASLAGIIGNWESTFVSFAVGFLAVSVVGLIVMKGRLSPLRGVGAKPWMFCGGLLGVCGIFLNLYTVFRLGAALQTIGLMAGQIAGALLIDSFGLICTPKVRINPYRVAGVLIIAVGVVLVALAKG